MPLTASLLSSARVAVAKIVVALIPQISYPSSERPTCYAVPPEAPFLHAEPTYAGPTFPVVIGKGISFCGNLCMGCCGESIHPSALPLGPAPLRRILTLKSPRGKKAPLPRTCAGTCAPTASTSHAARIPAANSRISRSANLYPLQRLCPPPKGRIVP